jgi:hypothetical protein
LSIVVLNASLPKGDFVVNGGIKIMTEKDDPVSARSA